MSSRHLINPAVYDPSKLQSLPDPGQQLSHTLTSLTQCYPPQKIYSSHECHGLYSGPTSIAYLFLHLSRTHPQLEISGHRPRSWAKAYLSGKRSTASVIASRNGVINEELAFCAIHAALTRDHDDIKLLATNIKDGVLTAEQGSDEWLYGRAGSLYLLRLVRSWVQGSDDIVSPIVKDLTQLILSHGPSWPWHGKDYLGAVHGRIGIITQIILCDPSQVTSPVLLNSLEECLKLQLEDGNWPSSIDSGHHHLVQFCHGAPGFVISLKSIQQYFPPELQNRISIACQKAENLIFEKGLLTKEPNLCHGSTGNALALPSSKRAHFMIFTSAEIIADCKQQGWYIGGDDPYGLFCGLAGRAWGWAQVVDIEEERVSVIGYNDV